MLLAARHSIGVPSDLLIFVHGFVAGGAGHSCGPALLDAVASAVASAADFDPGSVVVTISEVPADKMKPTGSPN
jgi:hypothetical protein